MSKEGTEFKREMSLMLKEILKSEPVDCELDVWIQFFYKGNYGRDIDSGVKITLDSLNNQAWKDDNQIKKLTVELFEPSSQNEIRVWIKEFTTKQKKRAKRMLSN